MFDESYCSGGSAWAAAECISDHLLLLLSLGASPSVSSVASNLSDLSLTSVSSSESESPESGRPRSADRSAPPYATRRQCKACTSTVCS